MNNLDSILRSPVLAVIDALSNKLDQIPDTGSFAPVQEETPVQIKNLNVRLVVTIGPWSQPDPKSKLKNWEALRHLELKIVAQDGTVSSSTWLLNGSKEQITSYFTDPEDLLKRIEQGVVQSLEHLERDLL